VANHNMLDWPALDLHGQALPSRLTYERGVWGKVHGAPTDYRWISMTPAFAGPEKHLDQQLPLGGADVPQHAVFWRTLGDTCYAVSCDPSRAADASGRSGFLERQIIEWKRPPEMPATLGALLLLPAASCLGAGASLQRTSEIPWTEADRAESLPTDAPLPVSPAAIDEAVEQGLRELVAATTEEALADLYAALLAGSRAVSLKGLDAPPPPAAVAALLLPLPRTIADRISVAGWLPSSRLSESNAEELRRCWDLVLGGATNIPAEQSSPSADHLRQARAMARAVFTATPNSQPRATSSAAMSKPFQLTLWGPTAAGKTVLLAQLFLESDGGMSGWQVFPTSSSLAFIQGMRARMQTSNLFPTATNSGNVEGIEYVFKHTSGARSILHLEDRAGQESISLEDSVGGQVSLKERLGSADGLILLFDPMSDDERLLEARVWRTLEQIYVASGRVGEKDARPIAVCVSKADALIENPADFRRAIEAPDEFVRDRVPHVLVRALDHYCERYRLFPVSAVGVRLRHGVVEPAMFIDEALQPRICPGSRPFNLMSPFAWLLNELTGVS